MISLPGSANFQIRASFSQGLAFFLKRIQKRTTDENQTKIDLVFSLCYKSRRKIQLLAIEMLDKNLADELVPNSQKVQRN